MALEIRGRNKLSQFRRSMRFTGHTVLCSTDVVTTPCLHGLGVLFYAAKLLVVSPLLSARRYPKAVVL